jgi:acyl-CoA thioester hydrolase
MGVAYYANHFVWFEVARNAFTRQQGIDYAQMERDGFVLPVLEAKCRYHAPARYDDELVIEISPVEVRRRSVHFMYRIMRGDSLLAEGSTVQVLTSKDGRPRSFPPEIADRFAGAASSERTR